MLAGVGSGPKRVVWPPVRSEDGTEAPVADIPLIVEPEPVAAASPPLVVAEAVAAAEAAAAAATAAVEAPVAAPAKVLEPVACPPPKIQLPVQPSRGALGNAESCVPGGVAGAALKSVPLEQHRACGYCCCYYCFALCLANG